MRRKLVGKVDWSGRRKDDPAPILYFSGTAGMTKNEAIGQKSADEQIFEQARWTHRCMSFHYWEKERRIQEALEYSLDKGIRIFLDSGAFTLQTDPDCNWTSVRSYAKRFYKFLDKYRSRLHWYAGLDWRRDAETAWKAQAMMQEAGYYPVPVYHGNDPLSEFKRLLDCGFPLIAIAKPGNQWSPHSWLTGKDLRIVYDQVHHLAGEYKCALHGLAQTGKFMFAYPWYSVDSTNWLAAMRQGTLFEIDVKHGRINAVFVGPQIVKDRKANPHKKFVSPEWLALDPELRSRLTSKIKQIGLTVDGVLTDYNQRLIFNVWVLQEAVNAKAFKFHGARYKQVLL